MFTTSILPLPPPSSSLLPSLSQSSAESAPQQYLQHLQARRKSALRVNTPLAVLSQDERLIASRKLAIAMYGYSWLRPAGCNKTMLGRREEELEKEEVERQLREVEAQERLAMEQEEQERQEELRRQAEGGEMEGADERDLDDEVPEAEDQDEERTEDEHDEGDEDEADMDGDLDDDIPDADADGQESSWIYDTRREPDTESEDDGDMPPGREQIERSRLHTRQPQSRLQHTSHQYAANEDDPAATEAMVNAMLDEDELGEYEHQHDLDDDVPDMDRDLDGELDIDMDADLSDRDLDADVPAADTDRGWEHTDSELEESEMDISLLPPHPSSASRNPGTTHEEMRRVSGNRLLAHPPSLPPPDISSQIRATRRQQQHQSQELQPAPTAAPQRQHPRTGQRWPTQRAMMQTPATDDEVSALISTGGTSTMGAGADAGPDSTNTQTSPRRNWLNLNASGARRNLFGGFRGGSTTAAPPESSTTATASNQAGSNATQTQNRALTGRLQGQSAAGVNSSSGGLFTPSPRQPATTPEPMPAAEDQEPPRSRTRSGRLLAGIQVGRRTRR